MAPSFDFSMLSFSPAGARDERINIGIVVFRDDGADVRLGKRLERVRTISAAVDVEDLRALTSNIRDLDRRCLELGQSTLQSRLELVSSMAPIAASRPGRFSANGDAEYEQRIRSILAAMVDAEPSNKAVRIKRSKLVTQVKRLFRQERVLAAKGEQLDSHRIVAGFELDEGLVADFVLRNGAMHVVETVDVGGDASSGRRTISEIGIAALVLERARMKFGERNTNSQLVYNATASAERIAEPSLAAAAHQGATLINWASADDRVRFVHSLASLATPIERKRPRSGVRFVTLR